MKRILVTGATGNIGLEVVQYLCGLDTTSAIFAAVRDVASAKKKLPEHQNLSFRVFDFEDEATFDSAFKEVDILFLLRPPQISQVDQFFRPLLKSAQKNGIQNIVFLSVQGAEKSKVIPHNKIERLIKELGFNSIFVRPSYFMQNLTTTLLPEIVKSKTITLPSGVAKFNWVDVQNVGEASAQLILSFKEYQNKAYEITGEESLNFSEVARLMSEIIGIEIGFEPINPISFYVKKKREGHESGFAMVMTILHFLPRIQKVPDISLTYKMLTGKAPTPLSEFIKREKEKFTALH
jgi:uncharacterized protein YbjT (DUF2867 family)